MTACKSAVTLGKPRIEKVGTSYRYSVDIESSFLPDTLWYSVDEAYKGFLTESSDAAIIALLLPIMRGGTHLEIKGDLSTQLLNFFRSELQEALIQLIPDVKKLTVLHSGECLHEIERSFSGVATGFSGGVDSFSVVTDYFYNQDVPSGLKLTHLFFNNVGANGTMEEVELFNHRYLESKKVANQIGLPLIKVESNLDEFYRPYSDLHFARTSTLRNASIPLLLQRGIRHFLYASTVHFSGVYFDLTEIIAVADPAIMPFMNTENTSIFSVGGQYRRVDKIQSIADIPLVQKNLMVCVTHDARGVNCSKCQKCLRTMCALDTLGRLNDFSETFNPDSYYEKKDRYLRDVATINTPFNQELLKFFIEHGRPIPQKTIAIATVIKTYRWLRALAGRIIRKLISTKKLIRLS